MKEMDLSLLKALYSVHSPSMREKKMRRFIKRFIRDNVRGASVAQDEHGNLLITKGEADRYPCLCAHMDQVQSFHPKDFVCIESQGVIFGYSPKTRKQCGLGADDKNGIFIALMCLQEYDVLKCAFFVGEEIGCVGSSAVDISFFDDCIFCAQIDRRGNSDMVTSISYDGICSSAFVADADCETYGYAGSSGLMTDVEALRRHGVSASCINMSCGYYEPHTDREFTVVEDLVKCYVFVCHLIEDCTGDYDFPSMQNLCSDDNWRWCDAYGQPMYSSEYDECLDACCDMLENCKQMTLDEFTDIVRESYPHMSSAEFSEVYDTAKSYVRSFSEPDE